MPNLDLAIERADLAEWSAPLIADCLDFAYPKHCEANEQFVAVCKRQHRRVWLSSLSNEAGKAAEERRRLGSFAKLSNVGADVIEAIDQIILDELTEVVSRRYRSSPARSRDYFRVLIEATSILAQTRLQAA